MKKNYLILFLFAFVVANVFSQNDVTINVSDDVSFVPIEGAEVHITTTGDVLLTDVSGNVTFPGYADGMYDVVISANCYTTGAFSFTVAGGPVLENFALNAPTMANVFVGSIQDPDNPSPGSLTGTVSIYEQATPAGPGALVTSFTVENFGTNTSSIAVPFGNYNYEVTVTGDCYAKGAGSLEVSCDDLDSNNPTPTIFISSLNAGTSFTIDTTVTQNDVLLTADYTGTGVTYQWIDCNNANAPIAGETNQTFTATANGSYAVIITNGGCEDTSTCYAVTSLSIDELNNPLEFGVYPNPVGEDLTIKLSSSYNSIRVNIYSIDGKLVKDVEVSNETLFKTNVSELQSGTYLVKINADGKLGSSIVVKK